ncbi:molybdopterin-guanine dinucleotide biosynthesis protein MobB [Pedobacter riviphilus]|uniref:Molybdopterin-guanine dinucleotide biosynthesis protein MobB n=1 Tax=Pedobacter riviphilus TaxID=2766984 RepID=A0ABX6TPQ0_9SPHI|nr:DUF5712 family protein [Pedobacter riviphilus]QNR86787.1 molybdopterin-guanine dinucleotide biosynthesis protein MobB [Pedobacter riviphilus]
MFISISASETGNNKGSSAQLVHYLDKENRLFSEQKTEHWFNGKESHIDSYVVKRSIDRNIAKLSSTDAKFFLINISPSQKEIVHLKKLEGRGANEELKAFAIKIIDEYARNFHRKGINSNEDLLWFGKLENHRYYSAKDKEVKSGKVKRGEPKPGEQMHIQVIVSRKDITNSIKLSPMNNSRGGNLEHSKKIGQFDRVAFKASGEKVFDEMFDYRRTIGESFQYANTQKNGDLETRLTMVGQKDQQEKVQAVSAQEQHPNVSPQLLAGPGDTLLDLLLARAAFDPVSPALRNRKRKKRKTQQQELKF